MARHQEYAQCLKRSEKLAWAYENEFPEGLKFDLEKMAIPKALMLKVDSFSDKELKLFSHITANSYCHVIKIFEAFITFSLYEHVTTFARTEADLVRNRAIVRVCDEEFKHQLLFTRYNEAFEKALGFPMELYQLSEKHFANPKIASPLAKVLVALLVEYLSVDQLRAVTKTGEEIDPLFKKVLTLHAVEEAQHINADELVIRDICDGLGPGKRELGVKEFISLLFIYDGIMKQQDELDIISFERAIGRSLTETERLKLKEWHLDPNHFSFAISLRNSKFRALIEAIAPGTVASIDKKASSYERPLDLYNSRVSA